MKTAWVSVSVQMCKSLVRLNERESVWERENLRDKSSQNNHLRGKVGSVIENIWPKYVECPQSVWGDPASKDIKSVIARK